MAYNFFVSVLTVISCSLFCGVSYAEVLDVEINRGKISLTADDIDLKEILQVISEKTGMVVSYNTPETSEIVTCRINEETLTNLLSKLLKRWNYTLMYREGKNTLTGPSFLWLVGKVPEKADSTEMEPAEPLIDEDESAVQSSSTDYQ